MRSILLFVSLGVVFLYSCSPISERKQPPPTLEQLASSDLNLNGEQLANAYCGACHLKPGPELLDRTTWAEKVLPDMRKRMGLILPEDFGQDLPEDSGVPPGVYSKAQLIKRNDWEKILAYYLENSPDSPLPQVEKAEPVIGIPGFNLSQPVFNTIKGNLTTMLKIHEETGNLWLGDRLKMVYVLDSKNGFRILDSIPTDIAPVDITWNENGSFDLLTMGRMDPSNDTVGMVSGFWQDGLEWKSEVILSDLIRPVNLAVADWNGDGKPDRVISQFGNHFGKMSIYLSGAENYEEVILSAQPGARSAIAVDFDKDGDLDVLGLMTQAQEGVYVWLNEGEGKFKEEALLRFHPAFGASDFRFMDLDNDGHKDLIVVNGDNADLSQIPKNYHGIHVYRNNGKNEFEESWFYPMFGASGLEIADFDGDGDLDLFVLSFFPDNGQRPKENLVYFRQNEKGGFDPFVMKESIDGNWLTMTSGDVDGDGDIDVIVGSFDFNDLYKGTSEPWKPILFLENKLD
ncbi:FG-GAP repeat domain-containing protein [Algoriphagus sp.]|uniref:FG-GAP repeat domain-containing protein n=1 Tax=Algoriphagus sp. TaxID=1872435 RepID=UPI003F7187F3